MSFPAPCAKMIPVSAPESGMERIPETCSAPVTGIVTISFLIGSFSFNGRYTVELLLPSL